MHLEQSVVYLDRTAPTSRAPGFLPLSHIPSFRVGGHPSLLDARAGEPRLFPLPSGYTSERALPSGHHESSQGALAETAVEPRIEVIARESQADTDDLGQDHIPISMHPHLGKSLSELTGFPVCMKHFFQAQHSGRRERIDHC